MWNIRDMVMASAFVSSGTTEVEQPHACAQCMKTVMGDSWWVSRKATHHEETEGETSNRPGQINQNDSRLPRLFPVP